MSKIVRKNQLIFGENAGFQQLAQFGSLAAGFPAFSDDPDVIQALSNYVDGWFDAVLGNNSPAIEDMNSLCYLFAYQLTYLFQAGIAEWNTDAIYYIGSFSQIGGIIYMSLTDNNTGNNPVGDFTNWRTVGGGIITNPGDIIYGDANADQTALPAGTDGSGLYQVAGFPSWQLFGYWSGYILGDSAWTTGSTSFNDGSNSGGNTLHTRLSINGLTVTAGASNVAGVTFTPASTTALYEIVAIFGGSNNSPGDSALYKLTDGTTDIQKIDVGAVSGGEARQGFCGLYQPGTVSPVTVKIQLAVVGGGTNSLESSSSPGTNASVIEWTIKQLTP